MTILEKTVHMADLQAADLMMFKIQFSRTCLVQEITYPDQCKKIIFRNFRSAENAEYVTIIFLKSLVMLLPWAIIY